MTPMMMLSATATTAPSCTSYFLPDKMAAVVGVSATMADTAAV